MDSTTSKAGHCWACVGSTPAGRVSQSQAALLPPALTRYYCPTLRAPLIERQVHPPLQVNGPSTQRTKGNGAARKLDVGLTGPEPRLARRRPRRAQRSPPTPDRTERCTQAARYQWSKRNREEEDLRDSVEISHDHWSFLAAIMLVLLT
ncbi:hypothetical protein RRG08_026619 [Elysia crispata]|uniref:Uncharacterized protein n=1 Tax=Elysia crispata TaxID=231223 RepID=A0AAE1B0Q9_9GAST|nr:hypothetical protein RRG08_026619 [Elysia crispata]